MLDTRIVTPQSLTKSSETPLVCVIVCSLIPAHCHTTKSDQVFRDSSCLHPDPRHCSKCSVLHALHVKNDKVIGHLDWMAACPLHCSP